MPKIIVTGFEPFDGYSINPSEEIVKALDGTIASGYRIIGKVLPLDYNKAAQILKQSIHENTPEYIICMGQANRPVITLEQIGLNIINVKRPDNYGYKPDRFVIKEGSPAAYFSNINVHPIVDVLNSRGIPAAVSYHAGTYGCNWILFTVLDWIATGEVQAKAMFVHVPPLPQQSVEKDDSSLATMPLNILVDTLGIIIDVILEAESKDLEMP
ncbi:MAG: pyroglutamyl-peptidase I [Candidatus Thorarchaeota archaeon]